MRSTLRTAMLRSSSTLALALALGWALAPSAWALHQETPGAVRVTSGSSHYHSPGRSWDRFLAFSSLEDLASLGALRQPGRQLYAFNLLNYVCAQGDPTPTTLNTLCPRPPEPYITQITNNPGNPDNPSISGITTAHQWIAFDADGTFNGNIGPASLHRQIFLKDTTTGELRQLTFAAEDSVRPTLSSGGGLVVFESAGPLSGLPAPAGVSQLFIYDRDSRVLSRLTVGAAPSTNAMLSNDGGVIVFESSADLLGDGHDTGITQIFWATYDRHNLAFELHQVTNGNAPSHHPYVAEKEGFVAFDSEATNLPGSAGTAGSHIFIASVNGGNFPVVQQITHRDPLFGGTGGFGDCSYPAVAPGGDHVAFLCTGDPLTNGTTGVRLFVLQLSDGLLFQITGAGDIRPPIAASLGNWFVSFSTSSDLTGLGGCGYQLSVVDYFFGHWAAATQFGQIPPDSVQSNPNNIIGRRNFVLQPGDGVSGSQVVVTTSGGTGPPPPSGAPAQSVAADILGGGSIQLVIGPPDAFTHQASVKISGMDVFLPPVPVPGFGSICLTPAGDGQGVVDCDGIDPNGDVQVTQDHNTDMGQDPLCLLGCREDAPCQGTLPGPHRSICPVCQVTTSTFPTCTGGPYVGEACTSDVQCQAGIPCLDGTTPTCNGPVSTVLNGTFAAGGMRATLPLKASFSLDAGNDGQFCTADDRYSAVHDIPLDLRVTTGTAAAVISDRDDVLGDDLMVVEVGTPFSCPALQAGELGGARLVGVVPLLDVPNTPGLRDVIMSVRFEARSATIDSCAMPCTAAADCDDGNACNGAETCTSGRCGAGQPVLCDDGDPCNGTETCDPADGSCLAGVAPDCDDGNVCTDDMCVSNLGGCVHTNNTLACDDGSACTTGDVCGNGVCAGTPVANGTPCDDNSLCTTNDACAAGVCVGAPVVCEDGDVCNGISTCDPATGGCVAGTPPVCDDNNPCTDETCDPILGCLVSNNTDLCDDGDLCTLGDTCVDGVCTGTAVVCEDGNVCNGIATCDPGSGACVSGTSLDCDDGNPCTDELCDPVLGCLHVNNTAACNDGNACTSNDVCGNGVCSGQPVVCEDGNICNGVSVCNPNDGSCTPGVSLNCDDGNPCTDDFCDPNAGCLHVNNTASCNDGNLCTTGDICSNGTCSGTPLACEDGNLCNGISTCDPATGACQPGIPPSCDDGSGCTVDSCDPTLGCLYTNVCSAAFAACPTTTDSAAVLCRLDGLTAAVQSVPTSDVGGPSNAARLTSLVTKARKRIQVASALARKGGAVISAVARPTAAVTIKPRYQRRMMRKLRSAARLLGRFRQKVVEGAFRHRIEPDVADRLLALAAETTSQLTRLIAYVK
jgi:Tol biopolymer transport system component